MKRFYEELILEHFQKHRQMLFLMGPRQVGKTTTSLAVKAETQDGHYFSWDNKKQRAQILEGPDAIADLIKLEELGDEPPLVIFDEIHKFAGWKGFLKGFYDSYPSMAHVVVTGSARLDVFKKGGDSLMGRYLMYRFHPLSLAELLHHEPPETEIRSKPKRCTGDQFDALWNFGGFPDPFLNADPRFFNRWKSLRAQQLFHEDLRDLSRIQEVDRLEVLAELIRLQAGQLITYESLAKKVQVTSKTVKAWLKTLKSVYYCFEVPPWSKNVSRSLIKEPKYYLWDWSLCDDPGARAENLVACHLLKAVHFWTDYGFGQYGLYFVRDKNKREVDFLIVKDNRPWILVEVKYSTNSGLSPSLRYFADHLSVPHAFQVVIDMPYVAKSCFEADRPMIVPARTFLSQLV